LGLYLAGSAHAQSSGERGKLIDDAKKEGKVAYYTGASANDGNAFKSTFEKNIHSSKWNTSAPAKINCWENI